jgi:hypothetical protein
MTLNLMMTLSIKTLNRKALSIVTLSIKTLNIKALSIITFSITVQCSS